MKQNRFKFTTSVVSLLLATTLGSAELRAQGDEIPPDAQKELEQLQLEEKQLGLHLNLKLENLENLQVDDPLVQELLRDPTAASGQFEELLKQRNQLIDDL